MVTVDITNLETDSDDLAQFIKHLKEHFEEINKDYNVEISITEKIMIDFLAHRYLLEKRMTQI